MFGASAVWGLDVGRFGLKAVKVKKAGAGIQILAFDHIEYEMAGSVEEIGTSDQVMGALQTFIQRNKITKADRIIAGMPSRQVFSRFINLPPVERKRIPEIVKYEARQQIPFDLDEVIWDFQPIKAELVPGEEIEIGLFAIKKDIIDDFLTNLQPIKFNLYGIQISLLALYNFFSFDQRPERSTVVVDVGAENTSLLVIDRERFWIRNLPVAGNDLTKAIQSKFNVSFEEAEHVKRKAAQSKHAKQVFEVLQTVLRDLVSEIQRSIGYYKSLAKDVKFEDLVVMGNAFKLPGMEKFLADNLQYKVKALSELRNTTLADSLDADAFNENILTFGIALGLGVQGLGLSHITIDVLPSSYAQEREIGKKKPIAIATAALLFLALGLRYSFEGRQNRQLKQFETEGVDVLDKVKKLEGEYQAAKNSVGQNMGPLNQIAGIGTRRDFWIAVLPRLGSAIPKGVYLSSFSSRYETPGAPGAGAFFAGAKPGQPALIMSIDGEVPGQFGEKFIREKLMKNIESVVVYDEDGVPAFAGVVLEGVKAEERAPQLVAGAPTGRPVRPETALVFRITWRVKSDEDIEAEKKAKPKA
ncbi:MAG: type IV pilus assembly protein PilM [Planctomycetes bacterium]|nr:type IV pilus assembly protein PilM [Planctomycetota bacterium]